MQCLMRDDLPRELTVGCAQHALGCGRGASAASISAVVGWDGGIAELAVWWTGQQKVWQECSWLAARVWQHLYLYSFPCFTSSQHSEPSHVQQP